MTRFFAYGSLIVPAQMAQHGPATRLGTATLADHGFRITHHGYATLVPERGATAHGVLWEVPAATERHLDAYEGIREGLYRKTGVTVTDEHGAPVTAFLYLAQDDAPGRPRTAYLEAILAEARRIGFPAPYVAELETWRL